MTDTTPVRLYRGFYNKPGEEVDTSNLGMHWVKDPMKAMHWAQNSRDPQQPKSRFEQAPANGTIVEALVHPKHIMDNVSEKWNSGANPDYDELDRGIVLGRHDIEAEHPVRTGSPVTVVGIHPVTSHLQFKPGEDPRPNATKVPITITHNPVTPREGAA